MTCLCNSYILVDLFIQFSVLMNFKNTEIPLVARSAATRDEKTQNRKSRGYFRIVNNMKLTLDIAQRRCADITEHKRTESAVVISWYIRSGVVHQDALMKRDSFQFLTASYQTLSVYYRSCNVDAAFIMILA